MNSENEDQNGGRTHISEYYREFISIIFAIVLAQSLPNYSEAFGVWLSGEFTGLIAITALVGTHFTIILSWIGYHHLLAEFHYRTEGIYPKFRLASDFLIVIGYFVLISLATSIKDSNLIFCNPNCYIDYIFGTITLPFSGDVNIGIITFLFTYIPIYSLYILNDYSVKWSHEADAGFPIINAKFLGLFFLISILYIVIGFALNPPIIVDAIFVFSTIPIVGYYRYKISIAGKPESI